MSKIVITAAFAAAVIATPALAQVYNSAPADGFNYGSGNNYTPANAAVLTTTGGELSLRFHVTFQDAPASDNNGVYSFALGTTPISYDWGIDGNQDGALLTLTNILTGATVSYDPLYAGNDNYTSATDTDLAQNSNRLNYLSALGFDPNVNDTYSATLTSGGQSLTVYAKLGSGAPAVPEPATWALMLVGFAGVGFQMRRSRKRAAPLMQIA